MAIEALAPRRELFPRCTPLINLTSAGHETHDGHLAHLRPWAWNATNRPKPALARLLRLKSQTNRIQTRQETTNIGGVPYLYFNPKPIKLVERQVVEQLQAIPNS